jgi:hypothetical protein
MAHKVMMPTQKIMKRLGLEPNGRVQRFFTNTCYTHMDKYVPMDEGYLRTIVTIRDRSITYEMPYASYQYYGKRLDGSHKVKNYTTPNTCSYWDRKMVSAEMNDVVREVQDYMGGKR